MLVRLPAEVDWGPSHIATVCQGHVRLHDPAGARVRELAFDSLAISAAWLADGTLVTIDHNWAIRGFGTGGAIITHGVVTTHRPSPAPYHVAVAAAGDRFVACGLGRAVVFDLSGKLRWRFDADAYNVHRTGARGAHLTRDGRIVVVAHATAESGDPRPPGRGFLLIDLEQSIEHPRILARSWQQMPNHPEPTLFAFSADGTRMIQASPDPVAHVGAIRVGSNGEYVANQPGGAHALAIDPRGIIAAYAYPDQPRRFRIDYLDPDPGGPMIDVLDTLWIDPSLPDVAALAISPDSRSIACLASDGSLEVIVVP